MNTWQWLSSNRLRNILVIKYWQFLIIKIISYACTYWKRYTCDSEIIIWVLINVKISNVFVNMLLTHACILVLSRIRYHFVDSVKYSCGKYSFYFEQRYVLRISGSSQVSAVENDGFSLGNSSAGSSSRAFNVTSIANFLGKSRTLVKHPF